MTDLSSIMEVIARYVNRSLKNAQKEKTSEKDFILQLPESRRSGFLKTALAKAEAGMIIEPGQNYGIVSTFEVNLKYNLSSFIFQDADADWLHCIAAHRKKNSFTEIEKEMAQFDVIAGKIADDATNRTLVAYVSGTFGKMGSERADEFCISQLMPERLNDQYCFKTERALECLRFVEGEKIWLK